MNTICKDWRLGVISRAQLLQDNKKINQIDNHFGEMTEWLIVLALKTRMLQSIVGSNPTLSVLFAIFTFRESP